jgi:uncharacterized integral membrane protein (TIGR00697 family)
MRHNYRYLHIIAGLFTATLIITNLLNAKVFAVFGFAFPAGIITFPLAFLAGDILTEIYGYSVARNVIWTGFVSIAFMAAMAVAAIHLPPAGFWQNQVAFETVLAQEPRIVLASFLAYFGGEFCNSYILAKFKVRTGGKGMWLRFVSSTAGGQAVDTLVFMTVAYLGIFPTGAMITLFISSWIFKVAWEIVALPASLPIVRWLKHQEDEDHFDRDTDFNPFHLGRERATS